VVIFSLALRAIVFLSAAISRFPCCFALSDFLCLPPGPPKKTRGHPCSQHLICLQARKLHRRKSTDEFAAHSLSIAVKPDLSGFNYPTNLGSLAQADNWRENNAEIGIGKFLDCGITAQQSSLAICYLLTRAEIPFCFFSDSL
jgi:hypothetical protein